MLQELIVYNCSVSKSFGLFRNLLGCFESQFGCFEYFGVFRIFWGVSNLLGCFESFGVFRIFWGVSNLLVCFESFGVFRIFWGVSNLLGVFRIFWGVFQINRCNLICILRCFVISGGQLFFGGCFAHMGHRN
jgi:hypothetical protein